MLKLLRRLSYLFGRDRLDGELDEELRFRQPRSSTSNRACGR